MTYVGDFRVGDTFDVKFTTVNASGVPTALLGTPAVAAYVGNDTVELTAGITLTVDFDTRTGLNNVRVVATGANGYAAGNYQLVITAGTVDGNSVVGYVVAQFSLEARSAMMPTTAGRTLTVEADGMAHADLKEWLGVAMSALIAGRVDANAQVVGDKSGYGLSGSGNAAVADQVWDEAMADHVLAGSTGERVERLDLLLSGGAGELTPARAALLSNLDATVSSRAADGAAMALTAAAVDAIWDEAALDHVAAGSIGERVERLDLLASGGAGELTTARATNLTNLDAAVTSRAAPGAAMDLVVDAVDAAALATDAAAEIADKLLGRSIAGGADGGRTVTSALRKIRNRVAIAAGTMTVYQENDTTTDHTAAVTTAAGNPITEVDPV